MCYSLCQDRSETYFIIYWQKIVTGCLEQNPVAQYLLLKLAADFYKEIENPPTIAKMHKDLKVIYQTFVHSYN